jgi:hypothetical protein
MLFSWFALWCFEAEDFEGEKIEAVRARNVGAYAGVVPAPRGRAEGDAAVARNLLSEVHRAVPGLAMHASQLVGEQGAKRVVESAGVPVVALVAKVFDDVSD